VGAAKTAWGVHFDFTVGIVFKAHVDETYGVRCVRNEPSEAPTTPRFTVEAGVIHDAATMLDWQQQAPEDAMTWREATDFCNALMLNGAGWRLPSIKDLHALVDETRDMPAIDATTFIGTSMDYQWSSSMYGTFSDNVWALSFSQGFDLFLQVTGTAHVRCVRL
jgi:hypothetical protein